MVSDTTKKAVIHLFQVATVDALNAIREGCDLETYKDQPSYRLAESLRESYPDIVKEIKGDSVRDG